MKKHNSYSYIVAASFLLTAQLAMSATLRLDFSGTFTDCDPSCSGSPFEPLDGTMFSGSIEFSTDLTDVVPESNLGRYVVEAANGNYRIDTVDPAFNLNGGAPFAIEVSDNESRFSLITDDAIRFIAVVGGNHYELVLSDRKTDGTEPSWLVDDGLPSLQVLNAAPFAGFSIWEDTNFTNISTSGLSRLQYSVSIVPVPAGLPLLAASMLLLFGRSSLRSNAIGRALNSAARPPK